MAEEAEAPKQENMPADQQVTKPEDEPEEIAEGDVLEEDDDFEEFQDDGFGDSANPGEDHVEWEDNWDDEVEGEDDFTKRLRAELEKNNE